MGIYEFIMMVLWLCAGGMISYGSITNDPDWRCISVFGVRHRWGQLIIGLAFFLISGYMLYLWQTSSNTSIVWG